MSVNSPDIFLSYNRNDQSTARRFAEAFEREGFSVWWDVTLRSGETYDQITEDALRNAKAVVVLWSLKSVKSEWVRSEASIALRNKTLLPAMIELCERPVMFELKHTADLIQWKGDAGNPVWQAFVDDVRHLVGVGSASARSSVSRLPPQAGNKPWHRHTGIRIALTLAVTAVMAAALLPLHALYSPPMTVAASAAATDKSIAVLPLDDFSAQGDEARFADGLTEEILTALTRAPDLQVASRNSSFQYKHQAVDIKTVAKELGVAHVLEGSVRRTTDKLRVSVQLIRAADGFLLWSENYDRKPDDIIAVQEDIALQIATAMKTAMDPAALKQMMQAGTQSVAAYNEYLLGLALAQSATNGFLMRDSYDHFERARQLDPQFASAHARAAAYWKGQMIPSLVRPQNTARESLPPAELMAAYQERIGQAVATAKDPDRLLYRMLQAESKLQVKAAYGHAQQFLLTNPDLKNVNNTDRQSLLLIIRLFGGKQQALPLLQRYSANHSLIVHDASGILVDLFYLGAFEEGLGFARDMLQRFPLNEQVLYQAHRFLLTGGHVDEARGLVDKITGANLPVANMLMMRLRQACADKQLDTANRLYTEIMNDYREIPTTGPFDGWLEMLTMGRSTEADQRLQALDRPDTLYSLFSLMTYPNFNIEHFPTLKAALLADDVPLPVYQPIPYACPAPAGK